jgi:hypothetical protein
MDDPIPEATALEADDDIALAADLTARYARLRSELGKLIVGQDDVVELVMLTILAGGNSLIVGVPGLAKTLLIHSIAQVLDLEFSRIQFTPDLMPSDITGTDLVQENPETGKRELQFLPGPIFANIVLADEINRTVSRCRAQLMTSTNLSSSSPRKTRSSSRALTRCLRRSSTASCSKSSSITCPPSRNSKSCARPRRCAR